MVTDCFYRHFCFVETGLDVIMQAQKIEVEKYLGLWYEQARLPNFFERKCDCDISAQYTLQTDGQIEVLNSCCKSDGTKISARGIARPSQAFDVTFEVTFAPAFLRFLPFVWANYSVLFVDKDYSVALVGEPKKRFLWVLSRDQSLDSAMLDHVLSMAENEGYNLKNLIKVKTK